MRILFFFADDWTWDFDWLFSWCFEVDFIGVFLVADLFFYGVRDDILKFNQQFEVYIISYY